MIVGTSSLDSAVQFITVILIFIFILVLTYYTTKLAGGYQKKHLSQGNIKIVESMRLSNNKYLQIVSIGEKYFAIAVCKDTITYLGEIDGDSLKDITPEKYPQSFDAILDKLKFRQKDKENNEDK